MTASITFHAADVPIPLTQRTAIKHWLQSVAKKEKCTISHIAYIFCSDEYLHNINVKFLKHDTLTDIITFDYSEGKILSGEIYISAQRVKDNAAVYGASYIHELCRVLVHGLLHLSGYNDKTKTEKESMRQREEYHLGALFE